MNPFSPPGRRTQWRPDRWAPLRVCATWMETRDVKTVLLWPEDGSRITFEPGQFITLRSDIDGEPIERCYTIASSAAMDRTISIIIKKKPGGRASSHFHDILVPGATVEAFGPSGQFGPARAPEGPYALISAGSGITPMLSTLRTAADLGIDLDAHFVHAAHTPADFIAADELRRLAKSLPKMRLTLVPSRARKERQGARGRIDGAMLSALVPDLHRRTVLCCGPTAFMQTVYDAAMEAGVPRERYTQESFDFGTLESFMPVDEGAPTRRVTFARTGQSFDCAPGQTILQAARESGIPVAYSCGRGICGTCKSFKVRGTVTMAQSSALRQREIDRGFILPCSCHPETDVVLDR